MTVLLTHPRNHCVIQNCPCWLDGFILLTDLSVPSACFRNAQHFILESIQLPARKLLHLRMVRKAQDLVLVREIEGHDGPDPDQGLSCSLRFVMAPEDNQLLSLIKGHPRVIKEAGERERNVLFVK